MAILTARNVTKRFGGLVAVSALDFEIEAQAIASIIGPNGAGKTTFFNCVTGFKRPRRRDHVRWPAHASASPGPDHPPGHLPHLPEHSPVRQHDGAGKHPGRRSTPHLRAGCRRHLPHAAARPQGGARCPGGGPATAALRRLAGHGDLLARNLPYGAQRRLEIARALAGKPKLLLLDEPTAGMNTHETPEMMAFIRRLRDELGITILLIEHEMRVVMGISETVTVLDYGEKIAEGPPSEIQKQPQRHRSLPWARQRSDRPPSTATRAERLHAHASKSTTCTPTTATSTPSRGYRSPSTG